MRNRVTWTPEQKEQLKELFPNNTTKEVSEIMNIKFHSVSYMAKKLGLKKSEKHMKSDKMTRFKKGTTKGKKTWFKKGRTPQNKGVKAEDWMSAEQYENFSKAQFKKGNLPHNTKKIGTISIRKDRTDRYYLYIKVEENKWVLLQRYIYEKEVGDLTEDQVVRFKDGNPLNITVGNLEAVSKKENLTRNFFSNTREIIEAKKLIKRITKKLQENES